MSRNLRNALPRAPFARYSQARNRGKKPQHLSSRSFHNESRIFARISAQNLSPGCTKFCHRPVQRLHLPENKPHKLAIFSLTQNLKGVQQDRSLTVS
jgi:hypothetical protein